jgi:hypothetical protein
LTGASQYPIQGWNEPAYNVLLAGPTLYDGVQPIDSNTVTFPVFGKRELVLEGDYAGHEGAGDLNRRLASRSLVDPSARTPTVRYLRRQILRQRSQETDRSNEVRLARSIRPDEHVQRAQFKLGVLEGQQILKLDFL